LYAVMRDGLPALIAALEAMLKALEDDE
jgi:hypothetical protein